MRPIYLLAILAVFFVLYTEKQQQQTAQLTAAQQMAALNLQQQQLAINAANSPAGLINTVVGGVANLSSLTGYGLD